MDRTETVTFTNLCMLSDGHGRVLVLDRADPDWPGLTFPGGHVERAEPFAEAVRREMREETGLTIESARLCGVKDWYDARGRYMVLLYRADRFSGELAASGEGPVFWMPLEALRAAGDRLAKGMAELLEVFLNEDISEQHFDRAGGEWRSRLL